MLKSSKGLEGVHAKAITIRLGAEFCGHVCGGSSLTARTVSVSCLGIRVRRSRAHTSILIQLSHETIARLLVHPCDIAQDTPYQSLYTPSFHVILHVSPLTSPEVVP